MSSLVSHFHQSHESFTIIPHHLFQLNYLKPDEKYLLMWFKSRPPAFNINTKSLASNLGVGIDVIKRMSHNLQEHKHLYIKKHHSGHTEWHFFEKQEDYVHFASPLKSPYVENPHVENPHVDNPPVLVTIDPLTNIDPINKIKPLKISPSEDVQKVSPVQENFKGLWEVWPNSKQRIRAEKSYKTVLSKLKKKSPDSIKEFTTKLKTDIAERLRLTNNVFDDGFRNSMLSTYLNNSGWLEELPAKPVNIANTDEANEANNRKAADLLKQYGYDKK